MNDLLKGSIAKSKEKRLDYDDIAAYIHSLDNLAFLTDIVPKRVAYGDLVGATKSDSGDTGDGDQEESGDTGHHDDDAKDSSATAKH